ncbi:phosphomannomutase [Buttiauxella agrestis]|uniref:phosphomannomutase n=1 Tax=Buttiauxella agrestis TaxID=82977 RepID=UPI00155FF0D5|nr:phosphomannomutase [Buttiauxella agrestis]BCG08845.1 phosphoglucosamine mutase [Buttiauxella agrestis]
MPITNKVINDSGITFGTSGARGLVIDFTPEVCAAFAHSFVSMMAELFNFRTIAIAIDNRPSSYAMAQACASAITQQGFDFEYHGVVPTPALAHYSMQHKIPCIMITGSHIPFDRNGLKFYRPDGEISKEDERNILNNEYSFESPDFLPELVMNPAAASLYLERYISLFEPHSLVGKRIGIYEHSSAGREIYAKLFSALGAETISLGRSDEFVPIDTEAVSESDCKMARLWSSSYNFDAIFSTDGDGDRPLVSDENGNWLRGDILGLLAADALNIEALAIPVSCNTSIDSSAKFKKIQRTKIGSPFVIEAFGELKKEFSAVAGFEANGGFLLATDIEINGNKLAALPTRDAVLPALMLLSSAYQTSISALIEKLPQRFTHSDRLQNFPSNKSTEIVASAVRDPSEFSQKIGMSVSGSVAVDETDGARLTFANGDVIHLRPSGNAPELRCYAESSSSHLAENLVKKVLCCLARM